MTYDAVVDYLKDHEELFNSLIEDLDSYNGYLGEDRWYPMHDLSETLSSYDVVDAILMAYYGNFNPNEEYFRFNGYGNLESNWERDYSDQLDTWFVKDLVENYRHLDIDDNELLSMLDDLEKGEYE